MHLLFFLSSPLDLEPTLTKKKFPVHIRTTTPNLFSFLLLFISLFFHCGVTCQSLTYASSSSHKSQKYIIISINLASGKIKDIVQNRHILILAALFTGIAENNMIQCYTLCQRRKIVRRFHQQM